jgi:hypothetical protein
MQEEIQAIDAVSRAIDKVTRNGRFAELRLSNDIVLSLKPVPPLLLQAINNEFNPPKPPKVYIEEKGREEENPNDPTYLAEIERLAAEQELAVNDMLLGVGTAIKSIPEGYYPPESNEWVKQVEFASGIAGKELKIPTDDSIKRYLCWLRFYALETGSDIVFAQSLPMQLAGIREGEVEEVLDSFRGLPERRPDTNPPLEGRSGDGNPTNRAGRRGRPRN